MFRGLLVGLAMGFLLSTAAFAFNAEARPPETQGLWADWCFYKADLIPYYAGLQNFYVVTGVVGNYDGSWMPESYALHALDDFSCQRMWW